MNLPDGVPLRYLQMVSGSDAGYAATSDAFSSQKSQPWISPKLGFSAFGSSRMRTSSGTWPLGGDARSQGSSTQTGGIGGGRLEGNTESAMPSGQFRGFSDHVW